jgi:RNA polymerase sigma-70 factor, ECF subfamily
VQPAEEYALNPLAGTRGADRSGLLESVYRAHYQRIVGMVSRLTGDRGKAEDVAGEIFCKLAKRPSALGGREDLTAWIYRVATNAGFDALRTENRRRKREEAAGAETVRSAHAEGALDGVLRTERQERVRDVLAELKPRDAQLLLLRSSGSPYKEIAEAAGVAPGSVGTLLARAEAEFERLFRARHGDVL